jgi:transcriptional regulator GlxA family with amidase domain
MNWNVVFLICPEVEILDLAGPLQAFHEAARSQHFCIRTCSTRDEVRTHQGIVLSNLEPLPEVSAGDLVIVPGMPYAATEQVEREVIRWLRRAAAEGAHVSSICTGAFVLGEAGLLDGRRCTTHWSRIGELRRRYPSARVLDNRLYVTDDTITTSAGIASGIDMALALIEHAFGPLVALDVAREMVVYLRRDGTHVQESVYLDYRTHLHPGIHRVQDQLIQNPGRKFALTQLAKTAGMSPRNLTRVFRQATGISVNDFATRVRLELARTLIHDPGLSVDAVARRCGFGSARQLRRLWMRHFSTTPSTDRTRDRVRPVQ